MHPKIVFVVWFIYSRRAETLAGELHGQVNYQFEAGLRKFGLWSNPLRYLVQGWKTWRFLERERPEVVLVQSPPIFAPLIVALWCQLQRKTRPSGCRVSYAIDCHPSTFYSRNWRWALPLLRFLSQRAVFTLSS